MMMNWFKSIPFACAAWMVMLGAPVLFSAAETISAQGRKVTRQRTRSAPAPRRRTVPSSLRRRTPLPATVPLPASVDPFEALADADSGKSFDIDLKPTQLDPEAKATAKVVLRDRTLLVRMRAEDMPPPARFGVPRYALWAYLPNYDVKMYIGDLPITLTSERRGESDSAYRFTVLPRGATFGGLMLTAEPVRYEPIVNEALRPLLVGLTPQADLKVAGAAPALYGLQLPENVNNSQGVRTYLQQLKRRPSTRRYRPRNQPRRKAPPRRASGTQRVPSRQ